MAGLRKELNLELEKLRVQEAAIDNELQLFSGRLTSGSGSRATGAGSSSGALSSSSNKPGIAVFDSADLSNNVNKIEQFAPCFEAMVQDSKKLVLQVEDCRSLSDRLSLMVRRLDSMQSRAQQALACTEDIINLKECKVKLQCAIDDGNLPQAVSYIRQVHAIDAQISATSDDYSSIIAAEQSVKVLVQEEFSKAIQTSNLEKVIALCPLLQTLGLEAEARDSFLDFIEATVFIGVSADASSVDGATDPATGYAQSLSNIFNSTYIILQQYLPMVIQGMERSLGDVHFIKRLHAKCEAEAGLVLKRYMKFRNVKELMANVKIISAGGSAAGGKAVAPADMHAMLDELALLIQYCCLYSKYLKQLCIGAESRTRAAGDTVTVPGNPSSATLPSPSSIFPGPVEFDKMVDELINRYYMEGERYLMLCGARSAFPKTPDDEATGLDECFFVLQRCGQRAIATNNVHAACAVLHYISDLMSSQLLTRATELLTLSATRAASIMQEHMTSRYTRGTGAEHGTGAALSKGIKNAISLASSITGAGINKETSHAAGDGDDDSAGDCWGIARYMEIFNLVERCTRYTERLGRDIHATGESVFASSEGESVKLVSTSNNGLNKSSSSELDKLRLCKEDFDAAKVSFSQVLRQGAEKLASMAQSTIKELLVSILGRHGPLGGVKFDLSDEKFDQQPATALLPRSLTSPFETLLEICSFNLSESNKDMIVGMLADSCCERLEHYITQSSFGFAGALKFEECVRALSATFMRFSSSPIRGKFSRMREIMLVLTSDISSSSLMADSFSLTSSEIQSFLGLRIET